MIKTRPDMLLGAKKDSAAKPGVRLVFSLIMGFVFAGIVAALFGYNPFSMIFNLFKGAWVGRLNFGTTLEKFTTMILLGAAFNVCTKVQFFNLGLEGSLYLGALTYAVVGYQFPNLPAVVYIPLCMICSMLIGALWAGLPAFLKAKWNVNEICVTLLLNYVVTNFCGYAIYYIWTASTTVPQTPPLCEQVKLTRILPPSRAHAGLFIAIAVYLAVVIVIYLTSRGNKIKAVGQNPLFAEYIGINRKRSMILTVMVGGAIAGLAGGLEVGGLYGRFVDQFAVGATFNGLLASRLAGNNLLLLPVSAFCLASFSSGAYGIERTMGISRAFIDCFTAIVIMVVTMEDLYPKIRNRLRKAATLFVRKQKSVEEG